jgi:antitoxin ParD1/3/4
MHIDLPEELQRAVHASVESGLYRTPDEVIGQALRWWLADQADDAAKLQRLRAAVAVGAEQAERGEFVSETMVDIIAGMEKRHRNAV